jgi:hypothetical protein
MNIDTNNSSPAQPPGTAWKFIEELKRPFYDQVKLHRKNAKPGEVSLLNGVVFKLDFPNTQQLLETAYADLKSFLNLGGIGTGEFQIITKQIKKVPAESYRIIVEDNFCCIEAGDCEGIRRGIYFFEDELLRSGGPFLKKSVIERKSIIKTRISRCFFGPINRPPMNRNELNDNTDYYPENYLNRLAHEGINALWMTVSFRDLCPSRFFPEYGKGRKERLEKLRTIVDKCARYGIKIYIFCIEPKGFGNIPEYLNSLSDLDSNPYFSGHKANGFTFFCTSTPEGQEYLEDCTYYIFSKIPRLGGLIDINLGERPTHCYSNIISLLNNNCPRCSKRKPWEVFVDTTSAIARGIQKAAPEAEMISWLYVPSLSESDVDVENTMEVIKDIAAHTPSNVTLQYNFESMGKVKQLGKEQVARDYWLSWPGPSEIFRESAEAAIRNGAKASAKIQVGCSHEVASIPFVPVPGNLYKKYKAMHEIGCSTVMQCWYFGNYPGIMNKAAGELAFAPFPKNEDEFLLKLAEVDWNKDAPSVVNAWKKFQESYSNFPINLSFTWYGPLHDSIVWPLYLYPVDKPISPSWEFTFPLDSGDRIGECICYDHTLEETLELLDRMSELWNKGVEELKRIRANFLENRERLLDIGLAQALGIQISSANNIFNFYALREKLPSLKKEKQLESLKAMRKIVETEIKNSEELKELCLNDSRLGFHSEAEGYKYFPKKLDWRKNKLQKLLENDFIKLTKQIMAEEKIFPAYTGAAPQGKIYQASHQCKAYFESGKTSWQARSDAENIYFEIEGSFSEDDQITVEIEPCRLWPTQKFLINGKGKTQHHNLKIETNKSWKAEISDHVAKFSIPFKIFDGYYEPGNPIRVNVHINEDSWVKGALCQPRLRLSSDNPSNLGWLFL